MGRKIKFIILILLIVIVIAYLEWKISSGDLNFHYGKDGGIFRRLESILIFGPIFFLVMTKKKHILFLFLGFLVSILCSIIIYLLLGFCNVYPDLPFHILTCLTIVILFFYIEKLILKTKTIKNES